MALPVTTLLGCFLALCVISRGEAATTHTLTIELLVVVDYSDYKVWYERTSSNENNQKRHSDAINNIKLHVASLVKSSNIAYESLQKYSIAINAKLVDVLIMETPELSPWTETLKYSNGSLEEVVAVDVFQLFIPYAKSLQTTVPHDHAMILTHYELHKANKTDAYALGVADLSAECSSRSVSIVQDMGFSAPNVMAHELGHSLGCNHDGEDNDCKAEDGYIMTPAHELNYTKLWQFSSCSAAYIKDYIHNITVRRDNCMDKYQNLHPSDLSRNASWFGELYPADEQCRLYSQGSHFCRDHYEGNFTAVCQQFVCKLTSNDTCYYTSYGAGDGTPCGHGKWCMSNTCVDAPMPIPVPDNCIAGDQTGSVRDNKSCSEIIKGDANQCNKYLIKQKCCATCHTTTTTSVNVNEQCASRYAGSTLCWGSQVYQGNVIVSDVMCGKLSCSDPKNDSQCWTNIADDKTVCGNHKWCVDSKCVYNKDAPASLDECGWADVTGMTDYNATCDQVRLPENNYLCYKNSIAKLCCNTCQSIRRKQTGCEYGDKASNCYTDIPTHQDWCYDSKNVALCCESCTKYARTGHPGCEYGDRATNCLPAVPDYPGVCYDNSTTAHGYLCCETCSKHANNLRPDCKYGDRYSNCDAQVCPRYSDETRRKCCAACKDIPIIG